MGYMAAIGGAMHLAGTLWGASEQDKRVSNLKKLAETPGIDFTMLARDAMSGYNANYGGALDLSQRLSKDQQAILSAQEEAALPGIGAARGEALGKIRGLFADDATWLKGLQRRAGAMFAGRGTGGSVSSQIAGLKLSDTESMQRTQLGTSLLGSLIGGMRLSNSPAIQQFLGNDLSQQLATRSNERNTRLSMLSGAYMQPTGAEQISGSLKEVGGAMMGMGMMNMPGMGGGGGGASGGPQPVNNPVYKIEFGMGGGGMPSGGYGNFSSGIGGFGAAGGF